MKSIVYGIVSEPIYETRQHFEVVFDHYVTQNEQGNAAFHYGWGGRRMTDVKSLITKLCDCIGQSYPGASCHHYECIGVLGNIHENPEYIKLLNLRETNCNPDEETT